VHGIFYGGHSTIGGDEVFTLAQNLHRVAVKQNAAILSHGRGSRP
jgi:hypothetical protein